ncbi:MAG: transporter substrate-binding domain-containing protein, partial [Desulfobulbus sp.]
QPPDDATTLSAREKQWIKEHPVVLVGTGSEWAPFDFREKGIWQGLAKDYLLAVGKETGLQFDFTIKANWDHLQQYLRQGRVALLPAIYHDDKLAEECTFTAPYFSIQEYLFINDTAPEIAQLSDLSGKKVVFVKGANTEPVFRRLYPDIHTIQVNTVKEALHLVIAQKADGYIDAVGAVSHIVRNEGLLGIRLAIPVSLIDTKLRMACSPGKEVLCSIIDKGLQTLTYGQRQQIEQRWVLPARGEKQVELTAAEKNWLTRHREVRLGVDPHSPPTSYFDPKGHYAGIMADYLRIISQRTGLDFVPLQTKSWQETLDQMENGAIDLIDAVAVSPERSRFMDFSKVHISIDNVIVTQKQNHGIHKVHDLAGCRVGLVQGNLLDFLLRTEQPGVRVVTFADTAQVLRALAKGELDACITDIPSLDFFSEQLKLSNLKVAGITPFSVPLQFGVRKHEPELLSILNKGLATIQAPEQKEIYRRWVALEYDQIIDYGLLWKAVAGFLVLLGGSLYWNGRLQREIGRRKQTEEELLATHEALRQAKEQAEYATKVKSEFLANMSHEIRTPMNSVIGFAEILEGLIQDPVQRDYLNSIKVGGNALLSLINEILDLSKIEAGQLHLKPEPVNLSGLLAELGIIFKEILRQKDLAFRCIMDDHVPENIVIDGMRLRQIMLNLVGNAVKFTDKGAVEVRVTARQNEADATGTLVLTVSDTGIGIDPENLAHIFDAFAQAEGLDRKYGGTGLGLSICSKLVGLMQGTITVESKEGQGATFTVTLPGIRAAETGSAGERAEQEAAPKDLVFHPSSLLVVDDIADNRKLIRSMLHETAITVREADCGQTALDMLENTPVDLILLDLRMPGISGYAVIEQIRGDARLSTVPVIAMTASVMVEDLERVTAYGFSGHLRKPITRAALFALCARYLPWTAEQPDPESETAPKPGGGITIDSAAFAQLSGALYERWQTIHDQGDIALVEEFGETLLQLAGEHGIVSLRNYAEEIMQYSRSFNVGKVLQLLNEYPLLVHAFISEEEQLDGPKDEHIGC